MDYQVTNGGVAFSPLEVISIAETFYAEKFPCNDCGPSTIMEKYGFIEENFKKGNVLNLSFVDKTSQCEDKWIEYELRITVGI